MAARLDIHEEARIAGKYIQDLNDSRGFDAKFCDLRGHYSALWWIRKNANIFPVSNGFEPQSMRRAPPNSPRLGAWGIQIFPLAPTRTDTTNLAAFRPGGSPRNLSTSCR
jgi:hypothetical protein